MSDVSDYSWIRFYPEAADALAGYSSRQEELLNELYEKLPSETTYLHTPEKSRLRHIDPFTVFGILNRHISDEKKVQTCEVFKEFLHLQAPVPQNFHGIPPLSNENSMFFSFKDGKTIEDIRSLWELFLSVLGNKPDIGARFDAMVGHQYGIKFNITLGLYWIRPDRYFPLDSPSRAFLNENGIACSDTKVPSFADYLQLCAEVKEKLPRLPGKPTDFAQVTRGIYLSKLKH